MKHLCIVLLLAATAAYGQPKPTSAPATTSQPALSPAQLQDKLVDVIRRLPRMNQPPTAEQTKTAEEALELYRQYEPQLAQLPDAVRSSLLMMAQDSATALAEPQTMLRIAKARWDKADKKEPCSVEGYALAVSGIVAGDSEAALTAVKHMEEHPAGNFDLWAKSVRPTAENCGKKLDFTIELTNSGQYSLAKNRGKAIVLVFWTGGPKSTDEGLSAVGKAYQQSDTKLAVVAVGMDDKDIAAPPKDIKADNWFTAVDNGMLKKQFGPQGLPYAVVISPDGRAVFNGHPAAQQFEWAVQFALRDAARHAGKFAASQPASSPANALKPMPKVTVTPTTVKPKPTPETPSDMDEGEAAVLAEREYALARTMLKSGLKENAKKKFTEVIQKYPKTEAAQKALKDLAEMK